MKIERKLKTFIEDSKNSLTKEQIDKLYADLNLPNIPNIDKVDFLNYMLYFDTNPEHYKLYSKLKGKRTSWRDFKNKRFQNIKVRDVI